MILRKSQLAAGLLVLMLVLTACNALVIGPVLNEPRPTADIDATVQAVLQATAEQMDAPDQGLADRIVAATEEAQVEAAPPAAPESSPQPTQLPSPTPTLALPAFEMPVSVGPSSFPDDVNPLTGLKVANPDLLNRRPLAIKITNFPRRVRPQSGLMQADQVFEYYIEMGLTRFIAVFYGNDVDRVGPVRSGRFFDEHIVRMYNAIFAFASADRRVLDVWLDSDLVTRLVLPRPDNCPPLCRDPNNKDYNNLYTNTAQLGLYALYNGSDNDRYELNGTRFQTLVPWGGRPMEQVFVRYSRMDYNMWQYNAGTGLFERFQEAADDNGNGEKYAALFDTYTDEAVAAANVIVLFVPHEEFVKSSDTEVIKINLQGAGIGYAFRDGQMYEITWARPEVDSPLQFYRSGRGAGAVFPLKPGNTFFQVVGVTTDAVEGDDFMRFMFAIP